MQNRWKILAPVDLRSGAEARVRHAVQVAEALDGDLTLLYVTNSRPNRGERLAWPASAIARDHGRVERRLVLAGPIPQTVRRCASDVGADMVVLTAKSYRSWKRLWIRSAAIAIAAATDRPVCITKTSVPATVTAFRSILCIVALDGTDGPLLRFSEEVAQRCDATLVLLHLLPEVSEALLGFGLPTDNRPLSREVAEHRMAALDLRLARPYLTAIASGSAHRSVTTLMSEYNTDVVIAGRPDGAPDQLEAGAALSNVSCPVISVPVESHSRAETTRVGAFERTETPGFVGARWTKGFGRT